MLGFLLSEKAIKKFGLTPQLIRLRCSMSPTGQDGIDLTVSYLKSDDGLEVLKHLETLL